MITRPPLRYFTPDTRQISPTPFLYHLFLFFEVEKKKKKKKEKKCATIHDTSTHVFKQLGSNQIHDLPCKSILINKSIVFLLYVLRTQKVQ